MAGIRQRGWWDVIWDRGDERKLEVEVVEDPVVDGSKVLEFELGVPSMEPFKERDFIVVEERPFKNVGNPLMLLCVRWRVVDVAGNVPPRCSTRLSVGPVLCRTCDTRHPGMICGVTMASGWRLLVYLSTDGGTTE
ncbi:hypothetical protein SCLCIDRAFT_33033 [Scleroderma citrinum Foug A]|uniref:Uncharacterized protein n=1 Tax=Scleroderma citrinum Foug A TaxID=1036808 RepID=A0A0C3D762_9AGAM|nr:hypothetical protein SCLCIDRAFT_33033 [Scleroderma citrinum Foug A]